MSQHIESLCIEKMVAGGYGLGRSATGKVTLVHGVLPGEQVKVQIFRSKKSYDLGFITAIDTENDQRIEPSCPLFMQCGGCTLQHLGYADQVQYKEAIFKEDWCHFFKTDALTVPLHFVEAQHPFFYRGRIRLHIDDGSPCFYRHHSTKAIAVTSCPLAQHTLNTTLASLESSADYNELKYHLRELVLHHNPTTDGCAVELFFTRKLRPTDIKRINRLTEKSPIQTVRAYGTSKELLHVTGDELIHFNMETPWGSVQLSQVPGDFSQVNREQNQALLSFLIDRIDHNTKHVILDLFCGLGNFSIPLAKAGHTLTGIDLKRSSIRSATRNNEDNGTTASFSRMSAEDGVKQMANQENKPDIVILDPPRAGFKEGAAALGKMAAQTIYYIACDQQTQMRDIATLMEYGYRVQEITLVDMFPQTHHLESVVVLERV